MKKNVIWSNSNLDYEDWKEFFDEEYPGLDVDERIDMMYELNDEYLDDERMNLDIPVDATFAVKLSTMTEPTTICTECSSRV